MLLWPTLAKLCVAQQVVLWPVRVEPSCESCGVVLEVVLSWKAEDPINRWSCLSQNSLMPFPPEPGTRSIL